MKKITVLVMVGSCYSMIFSVSRDYNGNVLPAPRGGIIVSSNNPQGLFQATPPLYAGAVNKRFGLGGRVAINFGGGGTAVANAIVVQSDGKMVVAGYAPVGGITRFAIVRVNTDGSLDITFNGTGKQLVSFDTGHSQAYGLAIQEDGKIIIAGYSSPLFGAHSFALARLTSQGALDLSFNGSGKKTITANQLANGGPGADCDAYGVVIQSDGKIVVVGRHNAILGPPVYSFAVARLTTTGALDTTFNTYGALLFNIVGANDSQSFAVALQSDGKILLGGLADIGGGVNNFGIARVTTNGILDITFNVTGIKTVAFGTINDGAAAITLQSDGKLLVVGYTDPGAGAFNFAITRLLTDGTLDATFNGTGKQTVDFGGVDRATGVALQPNALMIVSGYTSVGNSLALTRLNPDGSLDPFFNGTGKEVVNVDGGTNVSNGMTTLFSDGSFFLAGSTTVPANDFMVTEILNNYTLQVYALEYPGQGGLLF
jgi:uncharacterized delta-60 repeat protein